MTIIERPVRIPRPAFLAAWEFEGLGAPPVVVEQTASYTAAGFGAELRRRSLELLGQFGLAADGALAPQLRAALKLLAGARREVYAWSDFGGHREDNGAILAAAGGGEAVRLITDGRAVRIEPVSPRKLSSSLVEALPACEPARIRPRQVPKAYYDADGYSDDPLTESSASADDLRHLMRAGRDAVHQLYAAVRDGAGERVRSMPLSAIDLTGRGRILSFVNDDAAGAPQINVYSGTRAHLTDALDLTLRELA
ncbi:ESAT-6 protein secretion system EspG family protein [Amycolatopsis sulphurea]|uniref:ESAT-6 protein secretion system EspG family protein n=1 Tax=Amycolatopsis sulphurea TaxID=76022 RepID=A0A2A9FAL6_9PSEU|nr:ESX secretion-associated protein EspG [Amycolatopsis sulphurea]PFG47465.1 ESAT-6 protein secretion system EspG family protein [Amycolatopsis sulphurea]